jgi:hypothetical protein
MRMVGSLLGKGLYGKSTRRAKSRAEEKSAFVAWEAPSQRDNAIIRLLRRPSTLNETRTFREKVAPWLDLR